MLDLEQKTAVRIVRMEARAQPSMPGSNPRPDPALRGEPVAGIDDLHGRSEPTRLVARSRWRCGRLDGRVHVSVSPAEPAAA